MRPFQESDEASVVALWAEVFSDDPGWNSPEEMIRHKLRVQRDAVEFYEAIGYDVGDRTSMGKSLLGRPPTG
jgi:hypothetical protein